MYPAYFFLRQIGPWDHFDRCGVRPPFLQRFSRDACGRTLTDDEQIRSSCDADETIHVYAFSLVDRSLIGFVLCCTHACLVSKVRLLPPLSWMTTDADCEILHSSSSSDPSSSCSRRGPSSASGTARSSSRKPLAVPTLPNERGSRSSSR